MALVKEKWSTNYDKLSERSQLLLGLIQDASSQSKTLVSSDSKDVNDINKIYSKIRINLQKFATDIKHLKIQASTDLRCGKITNHEFNQRTNHINNLLNKHNFMDSLYKSELLTFEQKNQTNNQTFLLDIRNENNLNNKENNFENKNLNINNSNINNFDSPSHTTNLTNASNDENSNYSPYHTSQKSIKGSLLFIEDWDIENNIFDSNNLNNKMNNKNNFNFQKNIRKNSLETYDFENNNNFNKNNFNNENNLNIENNYNENIFFNNFNENIDDDRTALLSPTQRDTIELDQENKLSHLVNIIGQHKKAAQMIHSEVQNQNEIIDNISVGMYGLTHRLEAQTRNVREYLRKNKSTCPYWIVINLLFITILVVLFL